LIDGDLSLIGVVIGMSVCPSPKEEGILLSVFLCDGVMMFQANVPFQEQMASPHLGRRERGFEFER
jgi:hypothetical protein